MSAVVASCQMDQPPDDVPLEAPDLGVRGHNTLKRVGIHTVGQIFALDRASLLAVRNFGQAQYEELREQLIRRGLMDGGSPRGPFRDEAE